MMEKAYSVFLCILLISVLFFPLTTAGRVLLDTPQNGDGSGGSKVPVQGSNSSSAPSATGQSSPSHATPSRNSAATRTTRTTSNTANPNKQYHGLPYQCSTTTRECSKKFNPRAGKK